MTNQRAEIILTDLDDCMIQGHAAPVTRRHSWRIIDYELEPIGPGRALTNGNWDAGPLVLRLGVSGHYRISFVSRYSLIRARLTGDRCFDECEPINHGSKLLDDGDVYREGYYDAQEIVWRQADLTDQALILDERAPIILLAIRLTPVEPVQDTRQVRWPMFFTNDGGNMGQRLRRYTGDVCLLVAAVCAVLFESTGLPSWVFGWLALSAGTVAVVVHFAGLRDSNSEDHQAVSQLSGENLGT